MADPVRSRAHELRTHWPIILACFIGMMFALMPMALLGPLTKPLQADLTWPSSQIMTCVAFLSAGALLGVLIVGKLLDFLGATRIAVGSLLLIALGYGCMALIWGPVWRLQALYFMLGLVGAGSNAITYTRVVGTHFKAARGMAIGIVVSGSGMAAILAPVMVQAANPLVGWRALMVSLAIAAVLAAILMARIGLDASNEPAMASSSAELPRQLSGMTRAEAVRDTRFNLMLTSVLVFFTLTGGLSVKIIPMLIDRGISAGEAALVASIMGMSTFAGRLATGWLLDRLSAPLLGSGLFIAAAAGTAAFVASGTGLAIVGAVLFGFLIGSELDLVAFMIMRFFGLRAYGQIYALVNALGLGCALGGPFICAAIAERYGDGTLYSTASIAFFLAALSLVALYLADRTRGRSDDASPTSAQPT